VDLRREVGRPLAELRGRKARVEEQRALPARTGLRELLRGHDSEREACVDELVRQRLRRSLAARHDLVPADLAGVADARPDRVEGASLEEIGRVHRVARLAQLVREGVQALGRTQCVVEKQYLGHRVPPSAERSRFRSIESYSVDPDMSTD
jgi:hypothetical protein